MAVESRIESYQPLSPPRLLRPEGMSACASTPNGENLTIFTARLLQKSFVLVVRGGDAETPTLACPSFGSFDARRDAISILVYE